MIYIIGCKIDLRGFLKRRLSQGRKSGENIENHESGHFEYMALNPKEYGDYVSKLAKEHKTKKVLSLIKETKNIKFIIVGLLLLVKFNDAYAQKNDFDNCYYLRYILNEKKVIDFLQIDTSNAIRIMDKEHIFKDCQTIYNNKPILHYDSVALINNYKIDYFLTSIIKNKKDSLSFWIVCHSKHKSVIVYFKKKNKDWNIVEIRYGVL